MGKAGFVLSLIAFEESELEKAIGFVDYAIRVLKTGIAAAERAGRIVKMATTDYDPFSSDPRPPVEEVVPRGIQFGCKLWSFKSVRLTLNCCDGDDRRSSMRCYNTECY